MGWYVLCRPRLLCSGDVRMPPGPSPIAAAGVTDNYSISAVKAALSHSITQSAMNAIKSGDEGRGGGQWIVGVSGQVSALVSGNLYFLLPYCLLPDRC